MNTSSVTVAVSKIKEVKSRLELIGRHAKRLGVEVPTLEVVAGTERVVPQSLTTVVVRDGEAAESSRRRMVEVVDCIISMPVLGAASQSHRTVAALESLGANESGERVVEVHASSLADAKRADAHRAEAFCCDHCKANRRRTWSILVEEVQSGRLIRLGNECASYYVGDPEAEVRKLQFSSLLFSLIREIEDGFVDGEYRGTAQSVGVHDAQEVAAHAIASVRHSGWTSRWENEDFGRRSENLLGTGVVIAYRLGSRDRESLRDVSNAPNFQYEVTDTDRLQALKAIEWLKGVQPGNDFLDGLQMTYKPGWVSDRKIYQAASLGLAWQKEMDRQRQSEKPPSSHIAQLKERIVTEVQVMKTHNWQTDFGIKTAFIMEDRAGNVLTWKTTSGGFPVGRSSPGHWYAVKGTVKAHTEFRGTKQTELTRLTIERDFTAEEIAAKREVHAKSMRSILAMPLEERVKIASSESTQPLILEDLLKDDESDEVRRGLALNPKSPEKVLKRLAYTLGLFRKEIASNPGAGQDLLDELASYPGDDALKCAVIANPNVRADTLSSLASHTSETIQEALLNKVSSRKLGLRESIILLSRLAESRNPEMKNRSRVVALELWAANESSIESGSVQGLTPQLLSRLALTAGIIQAGPTPGLDSLESTVSKRASRAPLQEVGNP